MQSDEKWKQLPGQDEHQMGSAVYRDIFWEVQNGKEVDWIQTLVAPKGGVRSGEWIIGAPVEM